MTYLVWFDLVQYTQGPKIFGFYFEKRVYECVKVVSGGEWGEGLAVPLSVVLVGLCLSLAPICTQVSGCGHR